MVGRSNSLNDGSELRQTFLKPYGINFNKNWETVRVIARRHYARDIAVCRDFQFLSIPDQKNNVEGWTITFVPDRAERVTRIKDQYRSIGQGVALNCRTAKMIGLVGVIADHEKCCS